MTKAKELALYSVDDQPEVKRLLAEQRRLADAFRACDAAVAQMARESIESEHGANAQLVNAEARMTALTHADRLLKLRIASARAKARQRVEHRIQRRMDELRTAAADALDASVVALKELEAFNMAIGREQDVHPYGSLL